MMTITEAELLEALAEASRGTEPEDARTVQELMASGGFSLGQVRKALHRLNAAGRLRVFPVTRIAIDGRARKVPGYTILPG